MKFIDTEGHERTHTFDYCALYSSGYAEAYAVKPSDRVVSKPKDGRPSLADTIDLIHAQGSLDGYAHRAVIVTDQDFSPGNVHNARYLRRARRFRDEKYVQEVRALLSTVGSRVLFHTLLQNSDVPGYRRLAVWNLIDDGVLIPELSGHVIDRSWLRVISNDMEVA
ncbi:hypothetical protein V1T76_15225 [Roseibium sp. FZY0029]|uniref:hypothetical protein n=1 Tax=Roseibium sp. FZY0029 TaxID=3116647 RepID=UPI002E99F35B|nr:hypothetical protein [Roseibium sp. FZY0029]